MAAGLKKIGLDEERINGALLFRMMESPETIVIHTSLKEKLEGKFSGLTFTHPLESVI